jgi:hypothetical protein
VSLPRRSARFGVERGVHVGERMRRFAPFSVALALAACGERQLELPAPAVPPAAAEAPAEAPFGWVPAEHKQGSGRWKDTGVYVDGQPVGVLDFAELPIALEPVWIEDVVSAPVKPGRRDPGRRKVKQRHYRFSDYLRAVGVDLAKVRELHVLGPKASETIVVSGDELRRRGRELLFRFGGDVSGKAIPVVPDDFGNGKTPDKVGAVMVYVTRKPPILVRNRGLELDGELVTGVPYFGEPLRGGVRVYVDDRLAAVIKRRTLEGGDAPGRFGLLAFLEGQGVDTSRVVEAWIVRGRRRVERLSGRALAAATFEAAPQAHGQILVGGTPAHVLALHTRRVRRDELPRILPDEE